MTKNEQQLLRLIEKHQKLDDEIDELSLQRLLLPSEKSLLKKLKMERLQARRAVEKHKEKTVGIIP